MGLTPLEGLIMGTRSGDIDAGAVTFIMDKEKLNATEVSDLLNKKSGVLVFRVCLVICVSWKLPSQLVIQKLY